MYLFTLRERYSEHGMQKVRAVDATTCFIHNCTSISLKLSPSRTFVPGSWNWPFICFLFDQTKDYCHWWPEIYNGCPYWSCRFHDERGSYSYHSLGYPEGWTSSYLKWHKGSSSDNNGWYTLDIPDPKAKRWDYVEFAVYARTTSARPTGWMTVGRTLITPPKATIQVVEHIKESESKLRDLIHSPSKEDSEPSTPLGPPPTWLNLLHQTLRLLNSTPLSVPTSQCFLCASLSRPLLAAVPLAAGNISAKTYNFSKKGQPLHVTRIPLWESYSTNTSFPFICFHLPTMNPLPICSLSYSTPLSPAFMQPGHFLWCNGSLSTSTINVSGTCFLVTVVPQLSLYTPTEFRQLALPSRTRRAVFLPVLVGLTLTTSVASLGLSGGAIGHALWASNDLQQKLQEALDTTAESLGSLQRQVTSLAQVALQNRRAIDLLTAEKGGTCLFLREECCYYVNESGLIEKNVVKLQELSTQLLKPTSSNPITGFFQSSLATYLLPILGPLIGMLLFCALLPCIMKFLQTQLQKISNQTFNQLLLRHYQPLMTDEPPTSPREQFTQC
ncbi:endogenous retrovirus group FC1 Env polyprotein-like [Marmota marmota marmota]|uniref:endogenous retrovirus group FC1 Env polyprotein-like n=1 Tax=Marmota marmota marmota TaxID=9994 RepID=UPI0007628949|nr:endogenous retrovirus group FC1 Env polyprotein-like [Marmota marmota marmota]XP_015342228.1 endogenous retrovirus group FC1 Env polyprotein-like [Marmota marmota marmota]XP_015342806.1 endogenous retrovirus group FC1 Env polyprotein-like [Marmota marmota marmota]XP_015351281.1 endogenous retrovirus group FC1 Env polyprotein-like [Marmota marmota marmota]